MPVFATLLSVIFLRERPSKDRLTGLSLIPLGVALIVGSGLFS
ncbi:EamA family transporter [Neorhizobium galegae]